MQIKIQISLDTLQKEHSLLLVNSFIMVVYWSLECGRIVELLSIVLEETLLPAANDVAGR